MQKFYTALFFAALSLVNYSVLAQTPGIFPPGTVLGNLTESQALPVPSFVFPASNVPTIAALKALSPGVFPSVYVQGYATGGDGGQGDFVWNDSSSAADNGCTIFIPNTAPATGRWFRQVAWSGWISVAWCGAFPDGVSDLGAAINLANAALTNNGGSIFVPGSGFTSGSYNMTTAIALKSFARLDGGGDGFSAGAMTPTKVVWAGSNSAPRIFDLRFPAQSASINNLEIFVPSTFTGIVVDNGAPTLGQVSFGGQFTNSTVLITGGAGNSTCLNVNRSIEWMVYRVNFQHCNPAIQGLTDNGTPQSTTGTIKKSQFLKNEGLAIRCPGHGWLLEDNTFEPNSAGMAQAISGCTNHPFTSLHLVHNWFGDATEDGGTWLQNLVGDSLSAKDNFFGGTSGSGAIDLEGVNGISIDNNTVDTFSFFIATAGTNTNGSITNNRGQGTVTSCILGSSAAETSIARFGNSGFTNGCGIQSLATNGYHTNPDGVMDEWGKVTVTSGTPLSVTFPKAFPSNCFNVSLTMLWPAASTNVPFVSTPCSTTGFSVNASGSGSQQVYWRATGN